MPSVYTHYVFADECISKLPERLRSIVEKNRKFYDLGQSGADLLFYYKPYKSNNIRKYGSAVHRIKANELFYSYRSIAEGSLFPERDVAYLAGFFTHFILDSAMHPYIWKCDRDNIARHFVIEVDYDRKLLLRDNQNPFSEKFLEYQKVDEEVCEIAAKYLQTTPKIISKILKSRKKFTHLISTQNVFVRGLLNFLFKISKNPLALDILIQKEENPDCKEISKELDKIFANALSSITVYGAEFEKFLLDRGMLGKRFEVDFE